MFSQSRDNLFGHFVQFKYKNCCDLNTFIWVKFLCKYLVRIIFLTFCNYANVVQIAVRIACCLNAVWKYSDVTQDFRFGQVGYYQQISLPCFSLYMGNFAIFFSPFDHCFPQFRGLEGQLMQFILKIYYILIFCSFGKS